MVKRPQIGTVVPHGGRMLLLDRLVDYDDDSLLAELTIRADSPFVKDNRVGAWIGLEYMAQAIAAFAGCEALMRGEAPKIGFLIGSRNFVCSTPFFPVGTSLRVSVVRELHDESGLASFSGAIEGAGFTAVATLTVFQPRDVEQFLQESHA